jgi:putative DNA primase/helicase
MLNQAGFDSTGSVKQKIYTFDDTGNSDRLFDEYGEIIRYCYTSRSWYYYDGQKWNRDNEGAVKRMTDETISSMRRDFDFYMRNVPKDIHADDYEKMFMKHLKSMRSNKSKTAMIKETEHKCPVVPGDFDRHRHLINTPDGIFDVRTNQLYKSDPLKYLTRITGADYRENAGEPASWLNFLNDIFSGDKELIQFIQKAAGYSLTGETGEDCAFFCYGTGRNGKSTFLSVLSSVFGEYAANIQPETIMDRKNSSSTSDLARLKGARFVTSSEPNEGIRLNEGLLKQLTGGDTVTASRKYEDEFEFMPEFKIWMSTNHKPVIRGTDTGIWSRIRLIPFTVRIPEEKIDRDLKTKLLKESSAILKWVLDGCALWQKEGLKPPKSVEEATKEYRSEMDVIQSFLSECGEVGGGEVKAGELYKSYVKWAKDSNEYVITANKFGRRITEKFEKQQRRDYAYYLKLKVKPEFLCYQINIQS